MADYDVRIRGGQVYTPGGLIAADVLIKGEKIAALVSPENPSTAAKEINARGRHVFPGIIDLHCHTREPGYTHKEDFYTASQAAAAGGITTMIDMPNVEPPTDTVETFLHKRELAQAKSIVDFGHLAAGTRADEIEKFARHQVTGFKIFQVSGEYPHDPRLAMNDDGLLYRSFQRIAATGLVCAIHPFNQNLFDELSRQAFAAGEPSNHVTFSKVYTTNEVWSSAVAGLLHLVQMTGVRLHLLHTHSHGSLRQLREAKRQGVRGVTAECDPKYFHLSQKDLAEKGPQCCPGGFIVHDEERMAEIWRSLADGTMDCVGSDHAPHTNDEVNKQWENAWTAAMGSPQYDHYFSIFATDYHQGKISLKTMVRILSEAPAKILGIYPQKGAILPGADADLVVADLNEEFLVTNDKLYTKVGWTPYAGWRMQGRPKLTLSRGRVVMENGEVKGEKGSGRYIAGRPNPVY